MSTAAVHHILTRIRRAIRAFESERSDDMSAWNFTVNLERDDLDGGWIAECVDLPGCMSQGETESEAMDNLSDAIGEWIAVRIIKDIPRDDLPKSHSHTIALSR